MLLGDLFTYSVLEQEEGKLIANIEINAEHQVFEGHFPGVPVLPGVCQVQAIKELMQDATGNKLKLGKVRDIKFMAMVIPEKMPVLNCEISYSLNDDSYKVNAVLKHDETNVLKLRGNLRIA